MPASTLVLLKIRKDRGGTGDASARTSAASNHGAVQPVAGHQVRVCRWGVPPGDAV